MSKRDLEKLNDEQRRYIEQLEAIVRVVAPQLAK